MRTLRLAVMFVVAAACVAPQAAVPTGATIPFRVSQLTMASGLRVVSEVAPDFGVAGAVLIVEAGSADEPPDKGGLAYLVEHLVFESRREGHRFRNRLIWAGAGDYNATISWDQTTFYAFGPTTAFPSLASLLAEVVDDPLAGADQATFEHERQVVLDELHSRAENGTPRQAFGALASEVFPRGHPYGRPVFGTEQSIRGLTLADAQRFAKEHYRPTRAVLALSSPTPFDMQRNMVARIEAARGWPAGVPAAWREPVPSAADGSPNAALVRRELNVSTPQLWIGWSLPSRLAPEIDAAQLLLTMVGDTFWAHVYDHDPDIAYVSAHIEPGRDATVFYLVAPLKQAQSPQSSADSIIATMLHGLSERTFLGESLGLHKSMLATQLVDSEESLTQRTRNAATSLALTGVPTFL